MSKLRKSLLVLQHLDHQPQQSNSTNNRHPLAKLLVTIFYLIMVMIAGPYELAGLLMLLIYPVIMLQLTKQNIKMLGYLLWPILMLLFVIGMVNPFVDREPWLIVGNLVINQGVLSWLTLVIKGCCTMLASYLLIATTSLDAIGYALRKIGLPDMLVTQLLMTYRYLQVLIKETCKMSQAYELRAASQNGIVLNAWGTMVGPLLLRSIERAQQIYDSMHLRGYHGVMYQAITYHWKLQDTLYAVGLIGIITGLKLLSSWL